MKVNNPHIIVLIGMPGVGKSTWLEQNNKLGTTIVSSDAFIEAYAHQVGKTYTEVFPTKIQWATQQAQNLFHQLVMMGKNIIVDRTNMTVKSRAPWLTPKNYRKVAIVFHTPHEEEHTRRLASRTGKVIPPHVLDIMKKSYQPPTKEEGFDEIHEIH